MSAALDTQRRALLTRAAAAEARRQAARERGDRQAEDDAERELRALWRAHSDLEGRCNA